MINPELTTTAFENIKAWLPLAPLLTVSVKLFNGLVFEPLGKDSWNAYLKEPNKLVVHRNGLAFALVKDGTRLFRMKAEDHWKKRGKGYGKVKFPAPGFESNELSQVVLRVDKKHPEKYNGPRDIRARYFPDVSAEDWAMEKAFAGLADEE